MPDWVIHLGGGLAVSRLSGIRQDVRFVLLGAILPDVFSRFSSITEDFLQLRWPEFYSLEVFHTPLGLFLVITILALLTTRFWRACGLLWLGAGVHILLDLSETKFAGYGQRLLFPLSYQGFRLNLFHYFGPGYYLVVVLVFVWLLFYALRPKDNAFAFEFSARRLKLVAPLILFALILPYFASRSFLAHNVAYGQFFRNPEAFEGKKVALHFSRIVSTDPPIVEEHQQQFELIAAPRGMQAGEWWSLEGIYQGGKIRVLKARPELGRMKGLVSLLGLIIFPGLWFGPEELKKFFRRKKV